MSQLRAFVLAAGAGTRLRPLTDRMPKCLVPIRGRPLLGHWVDLLHAHGVTEVLVNSHHLAAQVIGFVEGGSLPLPVTVAHEPVLLGTGGTLRANRAFTGTDPEFIVGYGDTLTNADLTALVAAHRRRRPVATLGLFRTPVPAQCGIAEIDRSGTVVSFHEKPAEPRSDLAFAGILVASPELYDLIPERVPCDLARDVLQGLAGRMVGLELAAYVRDVGTPDGYARAIAEAGEAHDQGVRRGGPQARRAAARDPGTG